MSANRIKKAPLPRLYVTMTEYKPRPRYREDSLTYESETPFDSIESSHQYIAMLAETITEVLGEVEADMKQAQSDNATRRKEALQLVAFNLNKLSGHITSSRRILNDLRTLRRLLLEERTMVQSAGKAR
jgi:hypothetical protein